MEIHYNKCIVQWRDIPANGEWVTADKVECPTILTIGWLVAEDEDTVKIADTIDLDGFDSDEEPPTPYGITVFPRGCVVDIKFI